MLTVSFCSGAFMPIMSAMIADVTGETNRKESFSLMYLSINLGFAMGQIMAGQLFYNHTRWIFWGQAFFYSLSALLVYRFVTDSRNAAKKNSAEYMSDFDALLDSPDKQKNGNLKDFFRCVLSDRVLTVFLLAIVLVKFCYAEISYLLPLQLSDLLWQS